jgi:hypothetical protein
MTTRYPRRGEPEGVSRLFLLFSQRQLDVFRAELEVDDVFSGPEFEGKSRAVLLEMWFPGREARKAGVEVSVVEIFPEKQRT